MTMNSSSKNGWKSPGIRRTDAEQSEWVADRQRQRRIEANRRAIAQERDDEEGRRLWQRGHLIPARIAIALDAKGLYGPEVDHACGTSEPDVDNWEAGTLYPTWEQTKALAQLCGITVRFFTGAPLAPESVFMCPPLADGEPERPLVWNFTQAALIHRGCGGLA